MSRILVTGGAGFIGSHVSEELVKRGHEVTVLDDLSGGFVDNVPSGIRLVRGSITNVRRVNQLLRDRAFESRWQATMTKQMTSQLPNGVSVQLRH